MNTSELKQRLLKIKKKALSPAPSEILELIPHMLIHLGSPDPELRDELIYSSFSTWIIEGHISPATLREILAECLSDTYLFLGIDKVEHDNVLTRSFSILIISAILHYHNQVDSFLAQEEVEQIQNRIFKYAELEKDYRGYVPTKGWAHAAAHLADCLGELAACKERTEEDLKQILVIGTKIIRTRDIAFVYGEDERLAIPILTVFKSRHLTREFILNWLKELSTLDIQHDLVYRYWQARNIKSLFRSLFFRTLEDDELSWINEAVLASLQRKEMAFI